MTYIMKGIKGFKGRHGEPKAQGSIYLESKKVADWSDDDSGGPVRWYFTSEQEEDKFFEYAKTYLKTQKDYDGNAFDVPAMDRFSILENTINFMSYAAQEEKELKKMCKNKIVFYAGTSDSDKNLFSVNAPYTAQNVEKVRKANKDLLEIVNEKLGLPFDDATAPTQQTTKKRKP